MNTSWPLPPQRILELFRQGAELVLAPSRDLLNEIHNATVSGLKLKDIDDDPLLMEATRRSSAANIRQWAASNVQRPGERVPPYIGPEALDVARDYVRRGLDDRALDSYRTAQSTAWQLWMEICFDLTDDPDDLRQLLAVSSRSIAGFIDDTIEAIAEHMAAEREELTRGTHAERMAAVALVLEGAPIPRRRAEAQLGYPLTGDHVGAVIWVAAAEGAADADPDTVAGRLEAAADALARAGGAGGRRLTIVASATSLWVWLPLSRLAPTAELKSAFEHLPDVRLAIGRPGHDLEGFRRSHLDATTAQRLLFRLSSSQQVTHYQDVHLVSLLTSDLAGAEEFVSAALGGLATADAEIRQTVATYVRKGFNTSHAARELFTHRNTVIRRLARADELLPRPLEENAVDVAVALEIVRLRSGLG